MTGCGIKLDEVILVCPYCGKDNFFRQGMVSRACVDCGKGYFRPLPKEVRHDWLGEALNEGDGVYRP